VRLRGTDVEETRWVHSLWLRLLAQTGLVGTLLFAVFLGGLATAVRRARSADPARRTVQAALTLPLVVWLAHGSVEWLWEMPVLSVAALLLAAGAAASGDITGAGAPHTRRRALPITIAVAATVACLLLAASYVADRQISAAAAGWGRDPSAAFAQLRAARRLDPLSSEPLVVQGLIAERLGRVDAARGAFAQAAEREPQDWFAQLHLGLLDGRRDPGSARRHLLRARELNPREPVVAQALRGLAAGHPLALSEAQRQLVERLRRRTGQV
jgi:tetratricopeptide (TPR) repeat protein